MDQADVDAVVMAAAALDRLGLSERIAERLDPDAMLPQVGQGALAIECRTDDTDARCLLDRIEHTPSRRTVDAERGFLAELGGDCSVPAAANATLAGDRLRVRALVASADGRTVLRHELAGPAASGAALGRSVARQLLDDQGGAAPCPGLMTVHPRGLRPRPIVARLAGLSTQLPARLAATRRAGSSWVDRGSTGRGLRHDRSPSRGRPRRPRAADRAGAELLRQADVVIYDRLSQESCSTWRPRPSGSTSARRPATCA